MKIAGVLAVLWMLTAVPAIAAESGPLQELYIYPSAQYFAWEEFSSGTRLLKESGPLFGVGAAVAVAGPRLSSGALLLKGKAELFGSVVDYDGHTQDMVPIETDVTYFGMKGEMDLGWRFTAGGLSLEPFAGAGIRWWLRDIHDTATNAGEPVQGYPEYWLSAYTRVGLRGGYRVAEDLSLFAEAGAKYPFHSENNVDFPGVGPVTVRPGGQWSSFAEVGARYKWFRPSIFYESFRYSASPVVSNLFQPKSGSEIIGVNLGVAFR